MRMTLVVWIGGVLGIAVLAGCPRLMYGPRVAEKAEPRVVVDLDGRPWAYCRQAGCTYDYGPVDATYPVDSKIVLRTAWEALCNEQEGDLSSQGKYSCDLVPHLVAASCQGAPCHVERGQEPGWTTFTITGAQPGVLSLVVTFTPSNREARQVKVDPIRLVAATDAAASP